MASSKRYYYLFYYKQALVLVTIRYEGMSSRNKVYGLEGRYRGTLTAGTRTKENTVICYLRKGI